MPKIVINNAHLRATCYDKKCMIIRLNPFCFNWLYCKMLINFKDNSIVLFECNKDTKKVLSKNIFMNPDLYTNMMYYANRILIDLHRYTDVHIMAIVSAILYCININDIPVFEKSKTGFECWQECEEDDQPNDTYNPVY